MADTSKLKKVTQHITEDYSKKLDIEFKQGKVTIGKSNIQKQFSGVSKDKKTIIQVSHSSGLTSGGSIPVDKLNGLFAKCYLLEKVDADKRLIVFTNEEFFNIFKTQSKGIVDEKLIELEYYDNLPRDLELIINKTLRIASDEMK